MKIGIFSKKYCIGTAKIIDELISKGYKPNLVILETDIRKKFSKSEKKFLYEHFKYDFSVNEYLKKINVLMIFFLQLIWDFVPKRINKLMLNILNRIPSQKSFFINNFCENKKIDYIEVKRHSSKIVKKIFEEKEIDYVILTSSSWLLKKNILETKTKIINAHNAKLPEYRGLDSMIWSIYGKSQIGITTHFVDTGIDSGDIINFYEVNIDKCNSIYEVSNKINYSICDAFIKALQILSDGNMISSIQNTNDVCKPMTCDMMKKIDRTILSK